MTPFEELCEELFDNTDIDKVKEILTCNNINLNQLSAKYGDTPLLLTISGNGEIYEVTELLLQYGADPNMPDKNGWLALESSIDAAVDGDDYRGIEINSREIELLLKYGADINKVGGSGETAYERAKKFSLPCMPLFEIMMEISNRSKGKLVPFNKDFSAVILSEPTKRSFSKGIFTDNDLIHFHNDGKTAEVIKYDHLEYLLIGDDDGTSVALDINSDNICSIDMNGELPLRFINSNIYCLTCCLVLYNTHLDRIINSTDDSIESMMNGLKKQFIQIDAKAFSNDENWWSVLFFEIQNGLR